MSKSKSNTTVFHHTSPEGVKAIHQSGYIMQSQKGNGDAYFGDGTYVTKMGPDMPKDEVAKNNFDGRSQRWETHRDMGKVDVALEINIPQNKVTCVPASGRDVWKVDGNIPVKCIEKIHTRDAGEQIGYTTTIPKRK